MGGVPPNAHHIPYAGIIEARLGDAKGQEVFIDPEKGKDNQVNNKIKHAHRIAISKPGVRLSSLESKSSSASQFTK